MSNEVIPLIRKSNLASHRCRGPFLFVSLFLAGSLFASGTSRPSSIAVKAGFRDQGTFILRVAGQEVGRERFQIQPSRGGLEARALIDVQVVRNGRTLHFRTSPDLVLNARLDPLTYTWSQRGPETSELRMDLRRSPATVRYRTVRGASDRRTIQLPRDVIILDDNVVHQYEIAVLRYDMTSGGRQVFHAFIPQEALPGLVTIQDAGDAPPAAQAKRPTLRHLLLITDKARIDVWVDPNHRVQRVEIPAARFQAVRKS